MPPGSSVPERPSAFATASQSPSAAATGIDRPTATTALTILDTTHSMVQLQRECCRLSPYLSRSLCRAEAEVVEHRDAVRLGPQADGARSLDVRVLQVDIDFAVQ